MGISLSSRSESPEARNVIIGGVGNFTIRIGVRDAQGLEASSTCSVEMLAPVVARTNDELKEMIDDAIETLPTEDAIRMLVAVSESAPASSDDGGDQESKVAAETGREALDLISEEEQKEREEKQRRKQQQQRRDVVAARQELARNILDVASTLVTSITTRPSNGSNASVSNNE